MSKLKESLRNRIGGATKDRVSHVSELMQVSSDADLSILKKKAVAEGRFISFSSDRFIPDPDQPRKSFSENELLELRLSIEDMGQIQPILVRAGDSDGTYKIIAGERRWRAICASESVLTIDAVVSDVVSDELLLLKLQIHENNNRVDFKALESAVAVMRGVKLCKEQYPAFIESDIAKFLSIPQYTISFSRSIFNAPDEIKALSLSGITQDSTVLYNLAKSYKADPVAALVIVDRLKADGFSGDARDAAKTLSKSVSKKKKPAKKTVKKPAPQVFSVTHSAVLPPDDSGFYVVEVSSGDVGHVFKFDEDLFNAFFKQCVEVKGE